MMPALAGDNVQRSTPMKPYMLSVCYPAEATRPPPDVLEKVMRDVNVIHKELKAAGAWVFGGGLYPPSTATVVRPKDGELLLTDGPFIESKEHIGGFSIIKAPDLDAALEWARKLARAITVPIEVRPMQEHCEN
jgi:hypothetical protein